MKITQADLESAIKWYEHNDIEVNEVNFNNSEQLSLTVTTNDSNNYLLELSQEEIYYRAELWDEKNN